MNRLGLDWAQGAVLAGAATALLVASCAGNDPAVYDLLISGGTAIDGTGAARFAADVGVLGDRIVAVGDLGDAAATTVIDATGKTVAPGFWDEHAGGRRALHQTSAGHSRDRRRPHRVGRGRIGVPSEASALCANQRPRTDELGARR